jgi:hypothetical protein
MKLTEEVRKLQAEKSEEFKRSGGELYVKNG